MIVVGDPERCFEKMKHYADLGVDELICYVQFGYHSGESTLKTIELLGKEVLPELEKYTPVDVGANLVTVHRLTRSVSVSWTVREHDDH